MKQNTLLAIIILSVTMILISWIFTSYYHHKVSDEYKDKIRQTLSENTVNGAALCERKGMEFMTIRTLDTEHYETICYTKSPCKPYIFEIQPKD